MHLSQLESYGLAADRAATLHQAIQHSAARPPAERWDWLTRNALGPHDPIDLHRDLWRLVFDDWRDTHGPAPAWVPDERTIAQANITKFMEQIGVQSVSDLHAWSVRNREHFWQKAAEAVGIRFRTPPDHILEPDAGVPDPRWFVGARMNIIDSCFEHDRTTTAIIEGDGRGGFSRCTYAELRERVHRIASGLNQLGYKAGDALAVVMPMTADAVAIYLGIIQAGCCVVSISDSFASPEIACRFTLGQARGVFVTDHVLRAGKRIELYPRVIEADAPRAIVLDGSERPADIQRDGDIRFDDFLGQSTAPTHVGSPNEPINILFSSGTTGEPKAIPWDHTTPIKCATDAYFYHDIHRDDVLCWPTNLGWMMGPWLVFAALINRGCIALFNDPPASAAFGRFVQDAGVTMLGVIPTLVRGWRDTACMEGCDWSAVRAFSSTGELSNPDDMLYLMRLAGYRPVVEYCGGTEIGGGYITSTCVQSNVPGAFTTPALGLDMCILDENHQHADRGELFLIPPSVGLSRSIINRDHRQVYYESTPDDEYGRPLRRHGDQFQKLPGGYYRGLGRADDTMNLGGIKVSSGEIERAISGIENVKEVAAVAVPPEDGGPDRLVLFVVPVREVDGETLLEQARHAIRQRLNPLYKVHELVIRDILPRTASQKVMRRVLRDEYRPQPDQSPAR